MTTARFETVLSVVNEALVETGLSSSVSAGVFASTDPLVIQARTLLKACGQELIGMTDREWQSLHITASLAAAAAVAPATYGVNTLPTDLDHIIPQSMWNQTDKRRVVDVTPSQWEALVASVASGVQTHALIDADRLLLFPDESGNTITYRYQSRYWLAATGSVTPSKAAPTADTDVILFTPLLIKRLLKLRILMAKKLPYAEELADFEMSLAQEASKLAPNPSLSIGGNLSGNRFIDGLNVPETGLGS